MGQCLNSPIADISVDSCPSPKTHSKPVPLNAAFLRSGASWADTYAVLCPWPVIIDN